MVLQRKIYSSNVSKHQYCYDLETGKHLFLPHCSRFGWLNHIKTKFSSRSCAKLTSKCLISEHFEADVKAGSIVNFNVNIFIHCK